MSSNAAVANGKRAVLPKQLEKLDVALERGKSIKPREQHTLQSMPGVEAAKSTVAVATAPSIVYTGSYRSATNPFPTQAKSPTKQRNAINKVAVTATDTPSPLKRPASAPVHAAPKAAASPIRASAGSSAPGAGAGAGAAAAAGSNYNATVVTERPQSGAPTRSIANNGATGSSTIAATLPKTAFVSDTKRTDDNDDIPARGYYDVFIHTRRCEDLCRELGLTLKHIRYIKKKFDANDMYCTGEITQAEFFFMINEDARPISRGIFQFGPVTLTQKFLSFDQYVQCVAKFASLTKPELFQYVFDLYDTDASGTLDEQEFLALSTDLQSQQFGFAKNVATAIKLLGDGSIATDGLVDVAQFMKFARTFPVAFYPIVNMQKNVRAATLGETFWSGVVTRRLKTQELLSHMRRHYGAIPELTTCERIASLFSNDVFYIRKRAGELYATESRQRRPIDASE